MYCVILLFLFSCTCTAAHNLTFTTTQDGITLSVHIMQPHESTQVFLHNLHAYHVYPLQLEITNNTEKTWLVSGNSIEQLSLVPPHIVTKDIIFQHHTIATLTTYGCAIAGWLAAIAGFGAIQESLPNFSYTTQYISAAAMLFSFIYHAHGFVEHRSILYKRTQSRVMQYGLSSTNITIDPHTTITRVMFLNNKSYIQTPTPEDTFFYLFTVKLYNVYKSDDTITISVEVPKIYV